MRRNIKTKTPAPKTHEGAKADRIGPELQLRRSVCSCLLWESSFYESGIEIAERIRNLALKVGPMIVSQLAVDARTEYKLRHAPLWLALSLIRPEGNKFLRKTVSEIVQRPDEMGEFLAMYKAVQEPGRKFKMAKSIQRGLADAFLKFDAYQLKKWNREADFTLRDVGFLSHVKMKDAEHGKILAQLLNKSYFPERTKSSKFPVKEALGLDGAPELASAGTWEEKISATGGDIEAKAKEWTGLLKGNKLGALALLRNLRNMLSAKVEKALIKDALGKMKVDRVLPFRFITAARYAPELEPELERAMLKCLSGEERFPGRTILLLDVSGSMDSAVSNKTEVIRIDAAAGLAILAREICEDVEIYCFSERAKKIAPRHGFALRDAIKNSMRHGGTMLNSALSLIATNEKEFDRLIVFTDEQSHETIGWNPKGARAYCVNVAPYQNGVTYSKAWVHIDGFSEATLKYFLEYEKLA